MKSFFRQQAALCRRIARDFPQERIAAELMRIAADFEAKAEEGQAGPAGGSRTPRWAIAPQRKPEAMGVGRSATDHLIAMAMARAAAPPDAGEAARRRPEDGAD